MTNSIPIDVISDVVCPWCYVGKRRLERALAWVPEIDVEVHWKPFRLDPTIPPEGISREAYLTRKFGSVDGPDDMYQRLTDMGESESIVFRFDRIERSPNTVDAHRLIKWSASEGLEDDMVERLFVGYFSEGLDIGDAAVLTDLAEQTGFSRHAVSARLAGDEARSETVGEVENAYRIGVTGVPCFIVDQRIVVMGAHPPETIVAAINQAFAERPKASDPAD